MPVLEPITMDAFDLSRTFPDRSTEAPVDLTRRLEAWSETI